MLCACSSAGGRVLEEERLDTHTHTNTCDDAIIV